MARSISVTQFKARCLTLIERVATHGESVLISKRGRPVARLVPLARSPSRPLVGSVSIVDDDDDLLTTGEAWEAEPAPRPRKKRA